MNTKRLALTTLALAAAGTASAQSSVTLYGIADAYVQYLDGEDGLTRLQSGGINGSRLGVRGSEDLGGGLKAIFTLETGINIDDGTTGQGGVFWGRQAFVGLGSDFGTLTAGRQYGSVYYLTSDFSAFSNNSAGPSTAVIGGSSNGATSPCGKQRCRQLGHRPRRPGPGEQLDQRRIATPLPASRSVHCGASARLVTRPTTAPVTSMGDSLRVRSTS
jgi:hypothetical protein